jgi:hypothetical protein
MSLTANIDLSATFQPIDEPLTHDHARFDFDGSSRSHRVDNDGGNQQSLSNLVQQLSSLVQQLQSALQQLQQSAGQNGASSSPSSSGDSGNSGGLQGIIQELQQLLQQLSQLTQGNQGDPSSGTNGASGSPGGPQDQLNQLLNQLQQLLGQLNGQSNPSQSGQGGYQPTSYGSRPSSYGSAPYSGPSGNQGSIQIEPNNTVNTGRFTVNVSNATGGQLTVTDNNTGKTFTVWGDPHGTTPNGGTFDFQHHSLVYNLPDGTKIEVDPTQNSGVNYINSVEVTKGGAGVEFDGVHSGNITESAIPGSKSNANNQPVIGINVDNNDNQTVNGGPAINGNVGNIDQYATQQSSGYGSQGTGRIGEKLVHEGRELEQYGHHLQGQGHYREGARLIREGRHLEAQGRRLEHMANQYGVQGNAQVGQQLQQIQQLIEQISALSQQIGQANNSFANSYLNNNQAGAA